MKTLIFGSLNQDIVYDVDHFGQPGETTKALRISRYPGGKGLNQAIAASKAGSNVHMAGCIGPEGAWLLNELETAGVNATHIRIVPDTATGTAIIERDPAGANRILLDPGANNCCTPEQIRETLAGFEAGDLLICQNEISHLTSLLEQAKAKRMRILFNPAPMTPDILDLDLREVTWLAVNESECARLLGCTCDDPMQLCRLFRQRYPETGLVLTLGSRGSLSLQGQSLCRVPSCCVQAVDTTGAGDTWLGYFADGCTRGLSVPDSMMRANAAAALSVQVAGAASSIPSDREVSAFLAQQPMESVITELEL